MSKAKRTSRLSNPTSTPTTPLPKEISGYQVRWYQPNPGIPRTLNCSTLAPARTVARDLKAAGCFTRIGVYALALSLVE
jgi:hypothetical protein